MFPVQTFCGGQFIFLAQKVRMRIRIRNFSSKLTPEWKDFRGKFGKKRVTKRSQLITITIFFSTTEILSKLNFLLQQRHSLIMSDTKIMWAACQICQRSNKKPTIFTNPCHRKIFHWWVKIIFFLFFRLSHMLRSDFFFFFFLTSRIGIFKLVWNNL